MGGVRVVADCIALLLLWTRLSCACDPSTFFSLKQQWQSTGERCQQKLSFELWLMMHSELSGEGTDAHDVFTTCVAGLPSDLMQLVVDESWSWEGSETSDDSGFVLFQSSSVAAFVRKGSKDLEALCDDPGIIQAIPVEASGTGIPVYGPAFRRPPPAGAAEPGPHQSQHQHRSRRLKSSLSEAGTVHEVDKLVAGLEALGCENTQGEGQILCVMSDSFNALGDAEDLQASGDLPEVDVILDYEDGNDEGSAMVEVAYDIAPGASYKFYTAYLGETLFAEGIALMASEEACDVIVDDIFYYGEPSFRDGVISEAVDSAVVDEGVVYVNSGGNNGQGVRFTSNFECSTALFGNDTTFEPCDVGVASHVFDDSLPVTDPFRYLTVWEPVTDSRFFLKWDEDDDAARGMSVSVWYVLDDDDPPFFNSINSNLFADRATVSFGTGFFVRNPTYLAVHQVDEEPADLSAVAMQMSVRGGSLEGAEAGSIFGGACAREAISVASIDYAAASGEDGAFADPETSPVRSYSSRGPCLVRTGGDLEERMKPVTTAADGLSTSSGSFSTFYGSSASSPAVAAIATLIRAACAPAVEVTNADMFEMLTNYEYTIDYTSDADGAAETFGEEAGYGIISASQMLAWVEKNCAATCPGASSASPSPDETPANTPGPTSTPSEVPDVTPAPTSMPSELPDKTPGPTPAPTEAPVPATPSPTRPSTPEPTIEELTPEPTPQKTTSLRETPPPTPAPTTRAPTPEPTVGATPEPTLRETPSPRETPGPTPAPAEEEEGQGAGVVEVGAVTSVAVSANGFDDRPGAAAGNVGCETHGCTPELVRDGDTESKESRWSCKRDLVPEDKNCKIEFVLGDPQHVDSIGVKFYKWAERTRKLKVSLDNDSFGSFTSDSESEFTSFEIDEEGVTSLALESVNLDNDEWISFVEVYIYVRG